VLCYIWGNASAEQQLAWLLSNEQFAWNPVMSNDKWDSYLIALGILSALCFPTAPPLRNLSYSV